MPARQPSVSPREPSLTRVCRAPVTGTEQITGTEKVTRTTFDDGVRYMEFTEAVARSARTGQAVALPL